MTLLRILRYVPRSCLGRLAIIEYVSELPYVLSAIFDALAILVDTDGIMDLSFQEKSRCYTLIITAFTDGYCCPLLFSVVVREVVKCTPPPMLYRRVL